MYVYNRIEGMPRQATELTGKDGSPLFAEAQARIEAALNNSGSESQPT